MPIYGKPIGSDAVGGNVGAEHPGGILVPNGTRTKLLSSAANEAHSSAVWRKVYIANVTSGWVTPVASGAASTGNTLYITTVSTFGAMDGFPVPIGYTFEYIASPGEQIWGNSAERQLDIRVWIQQIDPSWNITIGT